MSGRRPIRRRVWLRRLVGHPGVMEKVSLGKIGEVRELREESISGFSCVEWRIPDVSYLPGKVEEYYRSDSFQAAGESWHLRFYPRRCGSYTESSLVKEFSSSECQAKYRMDFKTSGEALPDEFTGGTCKVIAAGKHELFCDGGRCKIIVAGEHKFYGISITMFKLMCRSFELEPSGNLTIQCFLQRAVSQTASCDSELEESPKTPKESSSFVETSQTQSEFSSPKTVKESPSSSSHTDTV